MFLDLSDTFIPRGSAQLFIKDGAASQEDRGGSCGGGRAEEAAGMHADDPLWRPLKAAAGR